MLLEVIYCLRCNHDRLDHLHNREGCLITCGCRDYDSSDLSPNETCSVDVSSHQLGLVFDGSTHSSSTRSAFTELGFIWAPYVPVIKHTPEVEYSGTSRRYADNILHPEYYGRIEIKGED